MPQKEAMERAKRRASSALFADLGRATRRGVRPCPKCATVNGTRGNFCKNKNCDVVFRENHGKKRKSTTDVCRIISTAGQNIFSVRLRDRGPDYRNFVFLPSAHGSHVPPSNDITILAPDEDDEYILPPDPGLPKCYLDICLKNCVFPCAHIKSAQHCFATAHSVVIKEATLANLNIPYEFKEKVESSLKEYQEGYIQRVSTTSFVVKCDVSSKHPLGFLHILFFQTNVKEDRNTEPKFLCTCRPYKIPKVVESNAIPVTEAAATTLVLETSSRRCEHYYACICAFASTEELELEFEHFVSHTISQVYSQRPQVPGPLEEIVLSVIPEPNPEVIDVEPMDESEMSVDIIRENMSLLESIADESSLPNTLESLNDQIVTTVDDSLNFGDSSALDGLDDPDAQVSGHLSHISEILSQTPSQQAVCQIFTSSGSLHLANPFGDPDRDDINDQSDFLNLPSNHLQNQQLNPLKSSVYRKLARKKKKGLPPLSGSIQTQSYSAITQQVTSPGFEQWLAMLNERINATMNYQLDGNPEPIVLFARQDHFDILKERISTGLKKKRLPNQTMFVQQRDRPPLGTFTKHVWRITNVFHILRIFSSSVVPLRVYQFFIRTGDGTCHTWNQEPPDGTKTNITPIIPVLHGTTLKIGKTDLTVKAANIPFIIEWTEDVLPQSKYGELSLKFQFSHCGPIHTDDERRQCFANLRRLFESHTLNQELSKSELAKAGIFV